MSTTDERIEAALYTIAFELQAIKEELRKGVRVQR